MIPGSYGSSECCGHSRASGQVFAYQEETL